MNRTHFNLGDLLDTVSEINGPDQIALIHGDRQITWPEMTARSNNLATALRERGAVAGDKVGFYLRNQPEYIEGLAACFKGRLTHVNVNYRYIDDELVYIFENSDSVAVLYDADFRDNIARIHDRLPLVKSWVEIGGDGKTPDFAVAYETLATSGDGAPLNIARSPDDQLFLYTGGTTGMPKGVMWPHHVWRQISLDSGERVHGWAPKDLEEHKRFVQEIGQDSRLLPACPLMHGTGLFSGMGVLLGGGTIVTMDAGNSFDPGALLEVVSREKVTSIALVGDAFAKPILGELNANPKKYDLSNLATISSSGVMWSMEVKRGLIEHIPQVALMDSFGASEAVGFGMSVTTADGVFETAKFTIGEDCKVFTEDDREVVPGSGEAGVIARGGAVPLGYYKDEAKTAKTFRTINGIRYVIPGDWCTVETDGTITLLGRGSNCINSAGEKIYPEEVEEALKEHDDVRDALVVGLPDDKWGQAVTAVVEMQDGANFDAKVLADFVKTRIARYKAPKHVFNKSSLGRAPNGKADYKTIRAFAEAQLEST